MGHDGIKEYVTNEALRLVGVPILKTELDENLFEKEILDPSLYEYFIYAPYEFMQSFEYRSETKAELVIPDPTSQAGWPEGTKAEYVGLTGFNFSAGFNGSSGIRGFDSYLLGKNRADMVLGSGPEAGMQSIVEALTDATLLDLTLGDEIFNYDAVRNRLAIYVPTAGRLGVTFGFRLNKLKHVKPSHAIVFSKIVAKKFLELLISARSSVIVSSEVTMDTSAMTAALERIMENFTSDMEAIATPMMTWG